MKIAIIGSGIAGNVVAYHLRDEHDITVFEQNDYIGGHSNTLEVPSENGPVQLDTGFMVFNDRTYPNFLRLLDELDVESQTSNMSFSVRCDNPDMEYNGSSINSLFAQRRNLLRPSFYRMVRDILRFNREAVSWLRDGGSDQTLGEYLVRGAYCDEFINRYLLPMGAAIWSADPATMREMPARFFVRFFENHGLLALKDRPVWKVIKGGSKAYVEKLVAGHLQDIRLNCPVQSVRRLPESVLVTVAEEAPAAFDAVFMACHSDQALSLLEAPLPVERDALSAIPYQDNEVVLHTDESLMPQRKAAWASWNYHIPVDGEERVSVTYHLNRLQGLRSAQQYFVTLNSTARIRPDRIIAEFNYTHPVFGPDSTAAQGSHDKINGADRIYYCGAYWRYGFHEDGVVSAANAVSHFRARGEHEQRDFQRAS